MNLQKNKISKRSIIFLTLVISVISLILFSPTFSFALAGGEDWLTLYRYIKTFSTFSSHFNLNNYIGSYDAGNIFMGIIYKIFGFNPTPFYLVSLTLRIFAAVTLFIAVYKWTNSKLSAFLSTFFFSVSYAGIEATNYSFNMTTYASLGIFNIFLFLYSKKRIGLPFSEILKEVVTLFIAFFLAPHRLHGLIILIPIVEFFRIKEKNYKNLLLGLLRITFLLLPIVIFRLATALYMDKYNVQMLSEVFQKNIGIFLYPVSIIGSTIFPDRIIPLLKNVSQPVPESFISNITSLFLPALIVFITISYFLTKDANRKRGWRALIVILYLISSIFLQLSLVRPDLPNLKNPVTSLETLIGGFTLITMILFFIINLRKFKNLAITGLFGLAATVVLNTIPWLARYTATFPSDHRYLIIPSAYFLTALSCLIAILIKQRKLLPAFVIIIIFVSVNIYSLNNYFRYMLENGRRSSEVNRYFYQIRSSLPDKIGDGLLVFLFTSNDAPMTLYHAITFGFSNHMVLLDPRFTGYDSTKVLAVDNKESLIKIFTNPESSEFHRYGMPKSIIKIENIYSYELKNKNLIENTSSLRMELSQISGNFKTKKPQ